MAKQRFEPIIGVPSGIYLITQDLLSSDWFQRDDINRMVAMGIESQIGIALAAVVGGQVYVIDGSLPESFIRLVLKSDPERGFACLESATSLVCRYSYSGIRDA